MAESDYALGAAHNLWRPPTGNSIPPKLVTRLSSGGTPLSEDYSFGSPRRKAHRRSPSTLKDSDDAFMFNGGAVKKVAVNKPQHGQAESSHNKDLITNAEQIRIPFMAGTSPKPTSPSEASNVTAHTTATTESGSSSGSASTVRTTSFSKRDDTARPRNRQRRPSSRKFNAFNFLDSDSPELTPDALHRSIETAGHRSPEPLQSTSPSNQSASSTSSGFRDDTSDAVEEHETDRSTSPERSTNGDDKGPTLRTPVAPRIDTKRTRRRSYGSPEISYSSGSQPYVSPNATTPRAPNQGMFPFPPRPERTPPSGYELLSSRLSSASPDQGTPALKPIYRRFQTLNHRLLLHLQDEICELEEQLHQLDSTDAQSRQLQTCMLPASRRAEQHSANELHWHRLDILGKIGFKVVQYNNVLSSFRKTQSFPTPAPADVQDYRHFLATHAPIAEGETRFLDAADDLLCIVDEEEDADDDDSGSDDSDDSPDDEAIATPMPGGHFDLPNPGKPAIETSLPAPLPPRPLHQAVAESPGRGVWRDGGIDAAFFGNQSQSALLSLALGVAGAVLLPVLAFAAIPGFLGRMAVVLVVLVGVLGALFQGNLLGGGPGGAGGTGGTGTMTRDVCVCAGCYGAVMAVLAGVMA